VSEWGFCCLIFAIRYCGCSPKQHKHKRVSTNRVRIDRTPLILHNQPYFPNPNMGKLSLESVVNAASQAIRHEQDKAKQSILALVKAAHLADPSFFQIPFNPFVKSGEEDTDSDESDHEEARAKLWFIEMKKASETSPTAKQILVIRKELCQRVQRELDELKTYTSLDYCMNTSPIFQELYCHLLQLEHLTISVGGKSLFPIQ